MLSISEPNTTLICLAAYTCNVRANLKINYVIGEKMIYRESVQIWQKKVQILQKSVNFPEKRVDIWPLYAFVEFTVWQKCVKLILFFYLSKWNSRSASENCSSGEFGWLHLNCLTLTLFGYALETLILKCVVKHWPRFTLLTFYKHLHITLSLIKKNHHHTSVFMLQDFIVVIYIIMGNMSTWYFLERL